MRRAILLVVAFLSAGPVSAEVFQAEITATPARTLPGMPVSFDLVVRNASDGEAPFPYKMLVLAKREVDDQFKAYADFPVVRLMDLENRQVAAGEVVHLRFPIDGTFFSPSELAWLFFQPPGKYVIRIYLVGSEHWLKEGFLHDEEAMRRITESATQVRDLTLSIDTPQGSDVAVYDLMLETARGGWNASTFASRGRDAATKVLREYPDSAYAGWFAATGAGHDPSARVEHLAAWLATSPRATENREVWLRRLGLFQSVAAGLNALDHPDRAQRYRLGARDSLQKALALTKHPATRAEIAEDLEYLEEQLQPR